MNVITTYSEGSRKIKRTYDDKDKLHKFPLIELSKDWVNGRWVNSYRYTSTYDANGNKLTYLYENWVNGQWIKGSQQA